MFLPLSFLDDIFSTPFSKFKGLIDERKERRNSSIRKDTQRYKWIFSGRTPLTTKKVYQTKKLTKITEKILTKGRGGCVYLSDSCVFLFP